MCIKLTKLTKNYMPSLLNKPYDVAVRNKKEQVGWLLFIGTFSINWLHNAMVVLTVSLCNEVKVTRYFT